MTSIITNISLVAAYITGFWLLLILVGLPLTLAFLPQSRWSFVLVLSPILAMAAVSGVSEHWLFSLLQPYRPLCVYGMVTVLSVAALFFRVRIERQPLARLLRNFLAAVCQSGRYLVVPLLGVLIFSSFFAVNGLEMLSAGEDEFAYVEVARHVIEHLYTQDAFDYPWPRADHYLADFAAHTLSYLPVSRLGAFLLLADVSELFRISVERAFPITIGVGIATGTASLALLKLLVRNAAIAIYAAQVIFATSWLLVMLHIQGSLSHVMSYPLRLGGLAFIFWSVLVARRHIYILLSGVLTSGWLVLYHESIGFGLGIPLVAGLLFRLWRARDVGFHIGGRYLIRLMGLAVLTFILQPQLVWIVVARQLGYVAENISPGGSPGSLTNLTEYIQNVVPPILGYNSLYDNSSFNYRITNFLHPYVVALLACLALVGSLGFLRRLYPSAASGWATMTAALAAVGFIAALHGTGFFLVRSAQMLIPNVGLGLSLLAFGGRRSLRVSSFGVITANVLERALSGLLWSGFVAINALSVANTILHVNSHSQQTDTIVRHFDPERPVWTKLREVVGHYSGQRPVLISGFMDTPTPHMIVHGLGSQPHLMGTSITKFWAAVDPEVSSPMGFGDRRHWLTDAQLQAMIRKDPVWNRSWKIEYARLLGETKTAIVPQHAGYPVEWGEWPSLFSVSGWRFPALCDVLDRSTHAFLSDAEPAVTGRDLDGPYWVLNREIVAHPMLATQTFAIIEVAYEGPAPHILLNELAVKTTSQSGKSQNAMLLSATGTLGPETTVTVSAGRDTRLRSVALYELPANALDAR